MSRGLLSSVDWVEGDFWVVLADKFPVDVFVLSHVVDLTETELKNITSLITGVHEFVGLNIRDDGANVLLDTRPVGHNVGEDVLKTGNRGELGNPGSDFLNITLDILAVLQIFWKLLDEFKGLLDSLNNIGDVSLHEVIDDIIDLLTNNLGVLEALLHLWKILLVDQVVDETSEELLNTLEVDGGVVGGSGGE